MGILILVNTCMTTPYKYNKILRFVKTIEAFALKFGFFRGFPWRF